MCGFRVDLQKQVETCMRRLHQIDAHRCQKSGRWRLRLSKDGNGARGGVDRHVETVLGSVVDDDVELERRGDESARARDDEHAWQGKAFRGKPSLRLDLRCCASGGRALGQEDDFPAPLGRKCGKSRHDTWFGLFEALPESVDPANASPEPPVLAFRQTPSEAEWGLAGDRFGSDTSLCVNVASRIGSTWRGTKELIGMMVECRVHVGEHAVEIDADP